MAGRSELIEAALACVQDLVTAYYAEAVKEACEATKSDPPVARLKTAEQMARAGRFLKLFRETGRRTAAAIAALPPRPVSSDPQESLMNDRHQWTRERIAELHADVHQRMAKLLDVRESKQMAGDDAAGGGGGVPAQPAADGGPSETPD